MGEQTPSALKECINLLAGHTSLGTLTAAEAAEYVELLECGGRSLKSQVYRRYGDHIGVNYLP